MIMDIHGERTYVYASIGAVVGVSAEPNDTGALLWESDDFDAKVIAPSPVHLGDGRIFVTAGYGAGSILLQVDRSADGFQVRTVLRTRPADGFSCEQQTPLVYQGHLFGVHPKDAGPLREQFACYNSDGSFVWSSGDANRFGLGPYLYADGKFLILGDNGVLTVIEASAERYRELGRVRILDGVDAWAPIALAEELLIARDSREMVCIDLGVVE
jgi:outer membrane protein assembly factor BamB